MGQVTTLLSAGVDGGSESFDELYRLLYAELRHLARARVRNAGDLTLLDTTSLVHEAYLRFERTEPARFRDRRQFMAYAARVMRSIIVDAVRARQTERRGGGGTHVEFDEEVVSEAERAHDREVMHVHESLDALRSVDPRLVQVVEMRYFAGMSEAEVAIALGVAVRTVARDWEKARMFLHATLR
jgi:RNA polymerase sigma factor (TIGR02999 family)